MPSAGANGTVQPLSPSLIHLIRWRLKDITRPDSRTVLTNMPTCANCHSFSRDGKTMGIDVDGPANDKGLYALVPVQKQISIQNKDVVQWNTDGQAGKVRVGFMSQVSPDGQYVVSTFAGTSTEDVSNTYYVTNFKDYRFLQVFYPTRGILEWYSRATGQAPAAARRGRSALRADGRGVESRRQIYCVCAGRGERSVSGRSEESAARQRSERDADSIRPVPDSVQRRQRAARRSRSPARRRMG